MGWSIMEVFLIDILRLKNKEGQRIFKFMKEIAANAPKPEPQYLEYEEDLKEPIPSEVASLTSSSTKRKSNILKALGVGSQCQIFSKSQQEWVNGEIIKIFSDSEGEWLRVKYGKDNIKEIQRYSEQIRVQNEKAVDGNWANLIFSVSMSSMFDSWKTYDYSTSNSVDIKKIEQRLLMEKEGMGKFKIVKVGQFVYCKKANPKGYKIAVRCSKDSGNDAQSILDALKSRLDAKLEKVSKVEKFKYKQYLDKIVKELASN